MKVRAEREQGESIGGQVEAARRALEDGRKALAGIRAEIARRAAEGASDEELAGLLGQRDEASWAVELREERVTALEGRLVAEQEAARREGRAQELERAIESEEAALRAYREAAQGYDQAARVLAEREAAVIAAADAVVALAPKAYRDWHNDLVLPGGRRRRAALFAGLAANGLVMVAPWHDQKHWGPLADDELLVRLAQERVGALQAELAELIEAELAKQETA